MTQLQRLELINVPLLNATSQFDLLVQSVSGWRDVKHLNLAQNAFNQYQLQELGEAIAQVCRLQLLDLSFNNMRAFFEENEVELEGKKRKQKYYGRSLTVEGFYDTLEQIAKLGLQDLNISNMQLGV